MSTVYVNRVNAFDATKVNVISFGYSGPQCIKNRIVIYDNLTANVVFDNTITSFNLAHTIPSGVLTNGKSYYCTITAYYKENNVEYGVTSASSNVFRCISTPVWKFSNISDNSTIGNSYYGFLIDYMQLEGERVNEFYVVVYTASHSVFWTSNAIYDQTSTIMVTGLSNDTTYYVRAYGTTVNGFVLDTRDTDTGVDLQINVKYDLPSIYSLAYLENNRWQGYVRVSTNAAGVEGKSLTGESIVFIDNKYADLTNGTSVIFDNGYQLGSNYTLDGLSYGIRIDMPFISFIENSLVLTFRQSIFSDGEKFFAELKDTKTNYVLYSNMITPPSTVDMIYFWIQRKDNLYNLKIENMGVI